LAKRGAGLGRGGGLQHLRNPPPISAEKKPEKGKNRRGSGRLPPRRHSGGWGCSGEHGELQPLAEEEEEEGEEGAVGTGRRRRVRKGGGRGPHGYLQQVEGDDAVLVHVHGLEKPCREGTAGNGGENGGWGRVQGGKLGENSGISGENGVNRQDFREQWGRNGAGFKGENGEKED